MSKSLALKTTLAVVVVSASALLVAWTTMRAQSPQAPPPQAAEKSPAGQIAIAEVDGEIITAGEVAEALGSALDKLEQQIYDLKRQQIDHLIGEKLIAKEADKRGMTTQALVASEIVAKTPPVSDQEVDRFFEANKSRLPQQADIKDQIRRYLQEQGTAGRRDVFIRSLRDASNVVVHLEPPPVKRFTVSTEGAPFRGSEKAPVTIVEFSDFHCPFCKRVKPTLQQVLQRYPDQVRLVYRDLPLDSLHPTARKAAEAARCANDQGKFWPYHDKLYEGPPDASPARLQAVAQEVGLDMAAYDQCVASGRHEQAIQASVEEAERLGATGTPAFFINGRLLSGAQPLEAFARIIDEELARQVATR
jgi:protein-disulfide isomerase